MKEDDLATLSHADLLGMCKLLLHNVRAVDGYWFYGVEEHYGRQAAEKIDEEVWDRLGSSEARKIVRQYNLSGSDLATVLEAIAHSPAFRCFVEYEGILEDGDHAVLRISTCLAQEARVRQGRGVFDCAAVEQTYFTSFARAIAPNVTVTRGFSPPDERRDGLWCEWHLSTRSTAP